MLLPAGKPFATDPKSSFKAHQVPDVKQEKKSPRKKLKPQDENHTTDYNNSGIYTSTLSLVF